MFGQGTLCPERRHGNVKKWRSVVSVKNVSNMCSVLHLPIRFCVLSMVELGKTRLGGGDAMDRPSGAAPAEREEAAEAEDEKDEQDGSAKASLFRPSLS